MSRFDLQSIITIEGDKCILDGVYEQGIEILDFNKRRSIAQQNTQRAILEAQTKQHFFLGIEHLEFLLPVSHAFSLPIVIIEKCEQVAAHFLKNRDSLPSNIAIVTGNIGLIPPQSNSEISEIYFLYSELVPLVLKLIDIKSISFKKYELHEIEITSVDRHFFNVLRIYFLFLQKRELWLERNATRLNKISQTALLGHDLILACEFETESSVRELIGNCVEKYDVITLKDTLKPHVEFIENFAAITKDQLNVSDSDSYFSAIFFNIDQVLNAVSEKMPGRFICRNFQANYCFEFALLLSDVVCCSKSSMNFLLVDWKSSQSLAFIGGWSAVLYKEIYKSSKVNLFSMYPVSEALYVTKEEPISFFAFNFGYKCNDFMTPDSSRIVRDVAIIHHVRSYILKDTLFDCLYNFLVLLNNKADQARFLMELVYLLNGTINSDVRGSKVRWLYWVKSLEWYFYSRIKIERIKKFVSFAKGLKVELFGAFSNYFPAEMCRDGSYSLEEVRQICRSSLVTLDVKPLYSWRNCATVHSVDCYASGGLPLIFEPVFPEIDSLGYDFSNKQNFITYNDEQKGVELVQLLKKNVSDRDQIITNTQSSWLLDLKKGNYFSPLSPGGANEIKHHDLTYLSILANSENASWILSLTEAIIIMKDGFIMKGIRQLMVLMSQKNIYHPILNMIVCRCLKAFSLNTEARQMAQKTLDQFPGASEFNQFLL